MTSGDPDLDIIIDMARHLGLDWHYDGPRSVFDEMRQAMPSIAGITWERLEILRAADAIFTEELNAAGLRGKKKKMALDSQAAVIILRSWLENERS